MNSGDFKLLTSDLCFKYVFSKKEILKDFINSFLEFINSKEKFEFTSIIPESYIMPNNKEYKLYYGDIVSTLINDNIISLELYKNTFTKENYNKSYAYMCRLFDQNIAKNGYKKAKTIYSINLIKGNFRRVNNELVNEYIFCNKKNKKEIDDGNTKMYLIRFDKVKDIEYNLNEKRFITWLRLISAKTFEELTKYCKEDKIMSDVQRFVAEWNARSAKGGFERYLEEQKAEAAEKAALKAEKQGILKIAKNKLSLNINIENIKKATGLSEKELNKLKKEIC